MTLSSGGRTRFGPFVLDETNECVVAESGTVQLTPKAYAVLCHLLARSPDLVTKKELLDAVWPDVFVGDAVLKVAVHEIRKALGDRASEPRYVQTLHRRGYRFLVPPVADDAPAPDVSSSQRMPDPPTTPPTTAPSRPEMVGREGDLRRLHDLATAAAQGTRQLAFVAGEAGLGKTWLVEAFEDRIRDGGELLVARGQCLEQYGTAESFLPVLDAVTTLCHGGQSGRVLDLLLHVAPTWFTQIPGLPHTADAQSLVRQTLGATGDRMLREFAQFLEQLTATTPLVLVLEDLHWSDGSTIELLSFLARRREPARLLVLGTYRPVEVILGMHPVRSLIQELRMHRLCHELPLELITGDEVAQYLDRRFPGHALDAAFAELLHERTGGNPFFLANVVDELAARGDLAQEEGVWTLRTAIGDLGTGVPDTIRKMLERSLERLPVARQRLVEAASVAGISFPTEGIAQLTEAAPEAVEDALEELARSGQFVHSEGIEDLPDGTVTARYAFRHALYQTFLYERVAPARRVRHHLALAQWMERVFGEELGAAAAQLARHFEIGRRPSRAVHHLIRAAENASRRHANAECTAALQRALDLLPRLGEEERLALRPTLLRSLGVVHRSAGRMAAAAEAFLEVASTARDEGDLEREVDALILAASAQSWIDRERCLDTCRRAVRRGERVTDELLRAHSRGHAAYWNLLLDGWSDADAAASVAAVTAARNASNPVLLRTHTIRHAYFQCLRSHYREGADAAHEGRSLALAQNDAFDYLLALFYEAWGLLHAGAWGRTLDVLEEGESMADRNGHGPWALLFRMERAWVLEHAGASAQAREVAERGLAEARERGHRYAQLVGSILLGYAHLGDGDADAASASFEQARALTAERRVLMDWIWQIPLEHGCAEVELLRGDLDAAAEGARWTFELAAVPGERQYQALAKRRLALIALERGDLDAAAQELCAARDVLAGFDAPHAAWRVHATSAEIERRRGDEDAQGVHQRACARIVEELAEGLDARPQLRERFLAMGEVRDALA